MRVSSGFWRRCGGRARGLRGGTADVGVDVAEGDGRAAAGRTGSMVRGGGAGRAVRGRTDGAGGGSEPPGLGVGRGSGVGRGGGVGAGRGGGTL